jgi:hypothetical protein
VGHTVLWNDATELAGGPLEPGAPLTLTASADDGGNLVASSIHVKARTSKPGKPVPPDQK